MRFCYLNILNPVDSAYLLERLPGVIFTIDPSARLVRIRSVGVRRSMNGLFWVVDPPAPQVNIYA